MTGKTELKLNIDGFTPVPYAVMGKKSKIAYNGYNKYIIDGKRLNSSALLILGKICQKELFGNDTAITYAELERCAGLSSRTIAENFKLLQDLNLINKTRQSYYDITNKYDFSPFILVFNFLLLEPLNLGGIQKVLSKNAALYLCFLINYKLKYPNKPIEGGVSHVKSFLNVPISTAYNIIKELLETKAISRNVGDKVFNENGLMAGIENIRTGKSTCKKEATVFIPNSRLIRRCERILRDIKEKKAERQEAKKHIDEITPQSKETKQQKHDRELLERVYNKYREEEEQGTAFVRPKPTEEQINSAIFDRFDNDKTFYDLAENIKALRSDSISALIRGDEDLSDALMAEHEKAFNQLIDYIKQHGINNIPESFKSYILNNIIVTNDITK